jgi:hypothetical protein
MDGAIRHAQHLPLSMLMYRQSWLLLKQWVEPLQDIWENIADTIKEHLRIRPHVNKQAQDDTGCT